MENETRKTMQYISIWGWHLSSLIFLVGSLLSISISIKLTNSILFTAFLVGFGICETISYKRKKEFYEDENEKNNEVIVETE